MAKFSRDPKPVTARRPANHLLTEQTIAHSVFRSRASARRR